MICFESIFDVFPDKGKAVMIPILTTAALLVSYRTDGAHWWEYLAVIERALEEAAPCRRERFRGLAVVPAQPRRQGQGNRTDCGGVVARTHRSSVMTSASPCDLFEPARKHLPCTDAERERSAVTVGGIADEDRAVTAVDSDTAF